MTRRTISAVLFDMDETLIVHSRSVAELAQDVLDDFRDALNGVDSAAFMRTLWQKANDLWSMMFDGAISGEVARPYTFINTLRALKMDESLALPLMNAFEDKLMVATKLDACAPGVIGALRKAGVRVGIVTNGYTSMQTRKLEHHGLLDMTDFALVSETVGFHKPHPKIFEAALARAGASAAEALFVGDHLENDVAGSLGVGMGAVLIDRNGEAAAQLEAHTSLPRPTHRVTSLEEVLGLAGV